MKIREAVKKGIVLGSLLPKDPVTVYDRVLTLIELQLERLRRQSSVYNARQIHEIIFELREYLFPKSRCKESLTNVLEESALITIERSSLLQMKSIDTPFSTSHNADLSLARLCYLICRTIKPSIVLETGVAYGVTSSFILQALAVNDFGVLHSVDIPPLGDYAGKYIGTLIPKELKDRWRLHRGISKRILPRLLPELGQINVFVHE